MKTSLNSPVVIAALLLLGCASAVTALEDESPLGEWSDLPEGTILVEEDILIPAEAVDNFEGMLHSATATNTWPNGRVPYTFDAAVTETNRQLMRAAMTEWEAVADVLFIPRTMEPDYIVIMNSTSNRSYVGRIGGAQQIYITSWNSRFIMAHELAHALGMWHEQSRPDRDAYVEILWANIQMGQEINFQLRDDATAVGPYDFDSVMHYSRCSFTTCTSCSTACETIRPRPAFAGAPIGQRSRLSDGDIAGMQALYGPPVLPDLVVTSVVPEHATREVGQSNVAWVTVTNQGSGAAGSFRVNIRVNGSPATCDTTAGLTYGLLAPGASQTMFFGSIAHTSPGTITIAATVDSCGQVTESDELNNTKTAQVTVTSPLPPPPPAPTPPPAQRRPDIVVERVTLGTPNPAARETFTIQVRVANRGTETSNAILVSAYTGAVTRCALPGRYVLPLLPGASSTFTIDGVDFDRGGMQELTVFADSCDNVAELDERNNTARLAIDVTGPDCSDRDGDGVCDAQDICPDTYNPDQADADGNGIGDACQSCDMCGTCVPMMSMATIVGLVGMGARRRSPVKRQVPR